MPAQSHRNFILPQLGPFTSDSFYLPPSDSTQQLPSHLEPANESPRYPMDHFSKPLKPIVPHYEAPEIPPYNPIHLQYETHIEPTQENLDYRPNSNPNSQQSCQDCDNNKHTLHQDNSHSTQNIDSNPQVQVSQLHHTHSTRHTDNSSFSKSPLNTPLSSPELQKHEVEKDDDEKHVSKLTRP
jgi:hypothetical protein